MSVTLIQWRESVWTWRGNCVLLLQDIGPCSIKHGPHSEGPFNVKVTGLELDQGISEVRKPPWPEFCTNRTMRVNWQGALCTNANDVRGASDVQREEEEEEDYVTVLESVPVPSGVWPHIIKDVRLKRLLLKKDLTFDPNIFLHIHLWEYEPSQRDVELLACGCFRTRGWQWVRSRCVRMISKERAPIQVRSFWGQKCGCVQNWSGYATTIKPSRLNDEIRLNRRWKLQDSLFGAGKSPRCIIKLGNWFMCTLTITANWSNLIT